ncbi:MAG: 1-acyl-sn-glycerol-3-phosphate acyltransferase [Candidatus Hydrogenedentes bacterium]|nr:1-acyl-sn-glycerol-3-phosphate acyltransferase [Candidatus Hydrogenedentota bacterium]
MKAASARARASLPLALVRLARMLHVTLVDLATVLLRRARAKDNHHDLQICQADTHHWLTRIIPRAGLRVTISGTPPRPGALVTPNHMGYVDIFAVGSVVPCFFVSKSDIASWPFIGYLLRSSRHVLVTRGSSKDIQSTVDEMKTRLAAGFTLCAFLEGTSSGGGVILPFRTSLLQAAIDINAPVVPTLIQWYADHPGIDITEDVAYWKDHRFGPHILRMLGLSGIHARIHFGDPVLPASLDRKELGTIIEERVRELHTELAGAPCPAG